MAAKTDINFAELIDLSVGTPEVVNYKGLRVLLAAIVSQLGVNNVSLVLNESGWNEGYQKDLYDVREAKRRDETDKPARPSTGNAAAGRQETNVSDIEKSRSIDNAGRPSSIEEIVAKVSRIEGQLNALPSNESLLARSGSSADGKTTPVSDMWQLMQVQKKAAANEEGVSKLMSMVQDMMRELQTISQQLQDHSSNISDLQQQHTNFGKDIDKIKEFNKTVESRLSSLEQSSGQQDKIDELNKLMDDLRNQLALLPHVDEIVTWPGFEAALKGAYKESVQHSESGMQTAPMVDNTRMQTRPLNDAFAQTNTPTPPTPPGSRPVSSRSTRSGVSVASVHPTSELQRLLRELGELTGRHNLLEDRVNGLEELLGKKADLSAVEALMAQGSVPDDLAAKLAELEEGLNHLRDSKLKDSDILKNLQSALKDLQVEVDKLNTSYVHLVDEHNVKQKHIDALYTFVDRLQENKADKEHVIMEIDVKADKHALDNKVSRSHFDGTVDELSKNLNEVMDKMAGHKVAWDSAVGELKLDIDNKLDRMELDPLKSYLDNRIKSVSAKYVRKEVETGEDAAGFRKPLQKFHCISCDRPLDMTPQAPVASLPENKGLPGSRSGRPYTTFELEQIRAAQKNGNYQDVPDYFVASRSCGGSHTMTFPHRRITRVSQMTNMVTTTEDLSPVVNGRVEADIQGQDGHIYKARLDAGHMTERLPVLTQPKMMRAKSPRVSSARGRRSHPPSRQAPDPSDPIPPLPTGAGAQRPSSARASPRPTSARPPSAATGRALSTAGSSAERTSPVPAPANTVDDAAAATPAAGGTGVQSPSPPPQQDPITVPQPPLDQDQS